jgi:hypothetical protein
MPEALVGAIRWGSLGPLLLASAAIMGSPGPATISLVGVGSAFGVRRALPYLVGITFDHQSLRGDRVLAAVAGFSSIVMLFDSYEGGPKTADFLFDATKVVAAAGMVAPL